MVAGVCAFLLSLSLSLSVKCAKASTHCHAWCTRARKLFFFISFDFFFPLLYSALPSPLPPVSVRTSFSSSRTYAYIFLYFSWSPLESSSAYIPRLLSAFLCGFTVSFFFFFFLSVLFLPSFRFHRLRRLSTRLSPFIVSTLLFLYSFFSLVYFSNAFPYFFLFFSKSPPCLRLSNFTFRLHGVITASAAVVIFPTADDGNNGYRTTV